MDATPDTYTAPSEDALRWLVLITAYFVIGLFLIGVFDLLLAMYRILITGEFTDPRSVIELIDTVLLLLIIVEVHRTLVAIVNNEPVVRIIISVAIIAVARQVISFRTGEFETATEALATAGAFVGLLVALVAAYVLIQRYDTDGSY